MALGSLTSEVPKARRWKTFIAGIGIDAAGLRPLYTPEARQLRLQAEVLLEGVFTASGLLHINRVVKGFGHRLDDSALAAAHRIQFHRARRDGPPYDCAALVHLAFELAE